ncbi:Transmembrane 9 super member 4 [Actinomortierella wolfii]|nr:Transmembrane 9 super member 4 [Actinomortierella wolfii]
MKAKVVLGLLGLASSATAIYIPGLSPNTFKVGDKVPLYVNKIFSDKSPLPYAYADLPFVCDPPKNAKKTLLNLGEVLRGDRISSSNYEACLTVGTDVDCKELCRKSVSADDAALASNFISNDYRVEWIVDNLPGATKYSSADDQARSRKRYRTGFPLGVVKYGKTNINNHVTIQINYQVKEDSPNERYIVGFEVSPYSIDSGDECPTGVKDVGYQSVSDKPVEIVYTYSVKWHEDKEITWDKRWDLYLVKTDPQVHWYSIVNSIVIILFLTGMVALIMLRTLNKDIALYNEEEMKDDGDDSAGWKLIHGDVFRTPKYSALLCPIIGSGVQILVMTATTMVFRGTSWTKNAILTATLVPGFLMMIVFLLNLFVWSQNSSGAIPFGTFLALVVMWFGISLPLSLLGAFFGQRKTVIEHPGRTNQIPRQIPRPIWYLRPRVAIAAGGVMPFAVIFIELFFLLKSIWKDEYYHMFGFLAVVFSLLLIACVETTVVLVYFQLCEEDYNWWWRSFFISSFSAVYIFLYSMVYYTQQLSIDHFVPALIYFTNSLMLCIVYGLLTGTAGFICTYWFIRRIYSAVKID